MLLEESAKKRAEQLRRSEAESAAREAQLKMLRYQLNPHFLFNTLNAINALVRLEELGKAQGMIQLLSKFLRHSLDQDYVENVTLEEEVASLKLYLDIEKARFEDRLVLEYAIEPDALKAMVPGLILQPIIENSIKYAISESEQGGTIWIAARVQENHLVLEISDTGPGLDGKLTLERRGVGLRNTIKRLETLYDSRYSFDVSDREPTGLTVTIRLPLEASEAAFNDHRGELAVAEALNGCRRRRATCPTIAAFPAGRRG